MERNYKQIILILVITFSVVGLIVWIAIRADNKNAAYVAPTNTAKLDPVGQVFENLGQTHIKIGESHSPYNSNPPTSGPHYVDPADWGVYDKPLVDEQAVHNLEHGGIWISYKEIDDQTKENLKKIAKSNSGSVIMSPRDANDSKIILASWTRLEKLDTYDEAKILDFISRNKNKSPEPIAK
jgi:hypothetical protein